MDRRTARKHVFQLVFQHDFDNDETPTQERFENYIVWQDLNMNKKDRAFMFEEYHGTIENIKEIDDLIISKLKKWDITRINKVDLAILRLANYELKFTDIPNKVAINEAIELAKEFSSDESPSFINGTLSEGKE